MNKDVVVSEVDNEESSGSLEWYLFRKEKDGLRKCGCYPVKYDEQGELIFPKNVVEEIDVVAVQSVEDPLDENNTLKSGYTVWVNPHKSTSPFTYET